MPGHLEGSTAGPSDTPFFFCLVRILHPRGFIKGGLKEIGRARGLRRERRRSPSTQ